MIVRTIIKAANNHLNNNKIKVINNSRSSLNLKIFKQILNKITHIIKRK